jgi:hypothetical protein
MYQYGPNGTKCYLSGLQVLTMDVWRFYFAFMAKQAGDFFITGTIDDLCFYKMDGVYYVRMKSSLTGKKFWKNNAFEGSRKSCERLAEGSRLASKVYRMIEEEKRVYKLYCFLKGKAILLLKEGKTINEIEEMLVSYLVGFGLIEKEEKEIFFKQYADKVVVSLYPDMSKVKPSELQKLQRNKMKEPNACASAVMKDPKLRAKY